MKIINRIFRIGQKTIQTENDLLLSLVKVYRKELAGSVIRKRGSKIIIMYKGERLEVRFRGNGFYLIVGERV